MKPPERARFYPARFVLAWANHETAELRELADRGFEGREVQGRALQSATGAIANYRIALEHIAHEVARGACPDSQPERVSFPVAIDAFAFRSMMVTRFPGLRVSHPKIWSIFRGAQGFAAGGDPWLLELHGLWNRSIPITVRNARGAEPPRGRAGAAPSGASELWLAYRGGRPVLDLLERIGPLELQIIDRLEVAMAGLEPPEFPVDRRHRRP